MITPILMLGAGHMGGAILDGWRKAKTFPAAELMIRDPAPGASAKAAVKAGAVLNPTDAELSAAKTVILSVKPQLWREVAQAVSAHLAPDAVIVSVAAGVKSQDLAHAFGERPIARVMPTTAVAIRKGCASLYAADPAALERARALFAPLGTVVELADENLMHAATAVSGSAPAYLYAFIESLEAAGVTAGLSPKDASLLARSTLAGSAALLAETGEEPSDLRRKVTSPGGTTEAALNVLLGEAGLQVLLREAVGRAMRRSKELGA